MLERLSERLQKTLRNVRGEGRVSERHIEDAMREIRLALLEADVHFGVVKEFVAQIKEQALGQDVLKSLTPGQQVVKLVRDQLIELLGGETSPLSYGKSRPSVLMLVGLQGSGKTTSAGKLALRLSKIGRKPILVSTDVYRPAAIQQLAIIGRAIEIPVFESDAQDPLRLAQAALQHCRNVGFDTLIVDKTGTLTEGKPRVVEIITADTMEENDLLQVAASLEERSEHPLGAAVVSASRERELRLGEISDRGVLNLCPIQSRLFLRTSRRRSGLLRRCSTD